MADFFPSVRSQSIRRIFSTPWGACRVVFRHLPSLSRRAAGTDTLGAAQAIVEGTYGAVTDTLEDSMTEEEQEEKELREERSTAPSPGGG
jgi:hypothetical protein